MSNKTNKRKDPMKGLIFLAVVMALLLAGVTTGANLLQDYRADLLKEKQDAVNARNQEKFDAYAQAVDQYKAELSAANQVNAAWPAPNPNGWDVVDLTNYPLEAPDTATVNRADIMNNGLLLVNEWHSRPEDFDDSAVVSLSGYARNTGLNSFWEDSSCKLLPQAADALIAMLLDAKAVGLEHYVLQKNYTYRTYDEQKAMFDKEVESIRSRHSDYTEDELIARAKRSINYPGTSEFNTGLSFKVYLYDRENENALGNAPFYETEQGKWLYQNSWKYGFVFRFPVTDYPMAGTPDKAYKTGVNSSFNFYRYVGVPNATVMQHLGLCLEEYIEYLMDHPHIAVFEDGVKRYEITREQVGDDATFNVEINRVTSNYTMYLDNMGGVVTVYTY